MTTRVSNYIEHEAIDVITSLCSYLIQSLLVKGLSSNKLFSTAEVRDHWAKNKHIRISIALKRYKVSIVPGKNIASTSCTHVFYERRTAFIKPPLNSLYLPYLNQNRFITLATITTLNRQLLNDNKLCRNNPIMSNQTTIRFIFFAIS